MLLLSLYFLRTTFFTFRLIKLSGFITQANKMEIYIDDEDLYGYFKTEIAEIFIKRNLKT